MVPGCLAVGTSFFCGLSSVESYQIQFLHGCSEDNQQIQAAVEHP
jgi:hypothetical protein